MPRTWAPVADIPDEELWAARSEARAPAGRHDRSRAIGDRLRRGEALGYADRPQAVASTRDALTIGFARRIASYKRIHLLGSTPEPAIALVGGAQPVQFVFAGKAHPQ